MTQPDQHPRLDQIRFSHDSAAPKREAAWAAKDSGLDLDGDGVGAGNGGDDFTFSFPRHTSDMYRVYGFGFELIDDTNTDNETLSVYSTKQVLLGTLNLGGGWATQLVVPARSLPA